MASLKRKRESPDDEDEASPCLSRPFVSAKELHQDLSIDDAKENRDPQQVSDKDGHSTYSMGQSHQHTLDEDATNSKLAAAAEEEEDVPTDQKTPQKTPQKQSGPGSSYSSGGYDAFKSFNGQVYKGMAVGGSHTWNYQPGVWKETKVEPDLWQVDYETVKKRAKAAPENSGAPVGTEYHWLIVAHQYVKKTDANTYETHLKGSKYKLAHKNASSNTWSVSTVSKQRDREMELLDDAKRRVQGLPPVLATEKVRVDPGREKGQQKLDSLFSKKA